MGRMIRYRAITSGRGPILRAFLRAWAASKSKGGNLRVVCDLETAEKLRNDAVAAQADIDTETNAAAWDDAKRLFSHKWGEHKLGWASKVAIIRRLAYFLADAEIGIWLDHDCEVRGDLRGLAAEFAASGETMGAPLYSTMGTGRYPRTRAAQNGLFLFRREAYADLSTWWAVMSAENMPNDESGFVLAFGGGGYYGEGQVNKAERKLWDVMKSGKRWYASCDCFSEIREKRGGLRRATARLLADNTAAVRHWCANVGKSQFLSLWGS